MSHFDSEDNNKKDNTFNHENLDDFHVDLEIDEVDDDREIDEEEALDQGYIKKEEELLKKYRKSKLFKEKRKERAKGLKKIQDLSEQRKKEGAIKLDTDIPKVPEQLLKSEEATPKIVEVWEFADKQAKWSKIQNIVGIIFISIILIIGVLIVKEYRYKQKGYKIRLEGTRILADAFQTEPEKASPKCEGAILLFKKALTIDKDADTLFITGAAYYYKYLFKLYYENADRESVEEDLSNAEKYFKETLDQGNIPVGVHAYLGACYYEREQYDQALSEFNLELENSKKTRQDLPQKWLHFIDRSKSEIEKGEKILILPPKPVGTNNL